MIRTGSPRLHRILLALIAIFVATLFAVYLSEKNNGKLLVYFLDVGQGDAIYIRTPGGKDMLIDAGPSRIVLEDLYRVMPWYDRSLDVVVETHPDADHIGGLPDVLERYRVGVMIEPGIESKNDYDDEVERRRKNKGVGSITARRGMRVNFGDGAHFDILYPDSDVSNLKDTNDASIVGLLRYGSTSVMLSGDASRSVEAKLVDLDGSRLKSAILKAGHHGSRTSSASVFLQAVDPDFAVISASKGNRYGHPHKDVIDLLSSMDIEIMETSREGTIEFVSDGKSIMRK